MALVAAAPFDAAHHHPDADGAQAENQAFYEFMVPLVKGYSTEMSIEVASLGVQVHGGMGFIEETGAAQYMRDAKILTIYEGTTAIQANDLVGRKTARDGGQTSPRRSRRSIESTEAGTGPAPAPTRRLDGKRLQGRARGLRRTSSASSPARPRPARTRCSRARCPTSCWPATWWRAGSWSRSLLVAEQPRAEPATDDAPS